MKRLFLLFLITSASMASQAQTLPSLRKQGTATQLIVNGKPFLMLAGELHNSASSSSEYMKAVWPKMKELNMNTILAPVYWELIEPEEGRFDFALVDEMIDGAERSNIKLVILWFASWKNGGSIYIPSWVKKNYKRFPRAVDRQGRSLEILSTLSDESMKADAKAFAALMKHLHEKDRNHTVLMAQIENEVGILNSVRDFSTDADRAFNGQIPADLSDYLNRNRNSLIPELQKVWNENGAKTKGTWEEVFGKSIVDVKNWKNMSFFTEEIFMAYHYARYMGYVAREGKKEHNIPMFTNAWLKGPDYPWTGRFPGGGPLSHVMDLWRCAAPSIDFISPDIYVPSFREEVELYDRKGNPMFIPETMGGETGASRVLFAVGEHNIMGFSPFYVDRNVQRQAETAPAAKDPLVQTYELLEGMSELILQHQGKGSMRGILVDKESPVQTFELGNYTVTADAYSSRLIETAPAGGLIIVLGKDEYIVLARNLNVRFEPKKSDDTLVGIDKVYEGVFKEGKWIPGRLLNGDETHCSTFSGTGLKMPGTSIQKISLYRYK